MPPDPPAPGEAPREASLADRAVFAAQFVRAPLATASVWPSSTALARAMADAALRDAPARRRSWSSSARAAGRSPACSPTAWRDGDASSRWRSTRCSRTASPSASPTVEVVPADVAELPALLALRGVAGADVVVSGLGWSATRPGREDSLVPGVARALADDGVLVQFAYCATSLGRAGACPARGARRVLRAGGDLVRGVAQPAPGRRPPGVPSAAVRSRR